MDSYINKTELILVKTAFKIDKLLNFGNSSIIRNQLKNTSASAKAEYYLNKLSCWDVEGEG